MVTSVVRTIWLRSCSRSRVILVRVVRPCASKKLLGLKCLMSLWSRRVSETDFEFEAVVLDVGADSFLHRLDEDGPLLLQLLQIHGGGDRTKAVDEFGLDQLAQFAAVVGAAAERLRGERDRRSVGFDAHIEFGADIDAHAVLGDQRVRAAAGDFQPQRLQVDRRVGMENRKHDRAAVEHDLLAAEAGADIGFVTGRAAIEFGEQKTDNENDDDANGDGYGKFPHVVYALSDRCCAMRSAGAAMAMKLLASRSTSSTLAPTGSGVEFGAGACDERVPVAVDILETDAAGQSLVERSDETSATWPTKSVIVDHIGLVAGNDPRDAAAGDADRGRLAATATSEAIDGRHRQCQRHVQCPAARSLRLRTCRARG